MKEVNRKILPKGRYLLRLVGVILILSLTIGMASAATTRIVNLGPSSGGPTGSQIYVSAKLEQRSGFIIGPYGIPIWNYIPTVGEKLSFKFENDPNW